MLSSRYSRALVALALVGGLGLGVVAPIGSATGAVAAGGATRAAKTFTVAYVQWAAAAGQTLMAKGVKLEAAKYGYTAKVANALGSAANANSLMQSFVTQHVNAIIVDSYSAANLATGIHAAQGAQIPVYIMYSPDPHAEPGVAVSLRTNAGELSAKAIIQNQGKKGSVLELTLPSGANCVLSAQAFAAVFRNYPGWKVQTQAVPSPGWVQVAASATKAWLLSHPKGTQLAIWGCWDDPAVGAASALAAANPPRWDVKLYGQDTSAASAALLEANHYGVSYFFNTIGVAQHMVDIVHGQAGVPYKKIKPVLESQTPIKVTPQNIRALIKKYPSILQG